MSYEKDIWNVCAIGDELETIHCASVAFVTLDRAELLMQKGCGSCERQLQKARELGANRVIVRLDSWDILGVEL